MTFDANGVLPAGIHNYTVEAFMAMFVDNFPTSQRRRLIADALWDFAADIFSVGVPFEFWVDGSFTTAKVNPNDADLVLFLQIPDMNILAPQWSTLRQKYSGLLDFYFAYATSPENQNALPNDYHKIENNRNYWRGQFGYDRKDAPKGIVRLSCESIAEHLKGR